MAVQPLQFPQPRAFTPDLDFSPLAQIGEALKQGRIEQQRREAMQAYAAGDPSALLTGDLKLADMYMLAEQRKMAADRDARDHQFRVDDARRQQGNADRSHTLQARRLALEADPTPDGFEKAPDGTVRPIAGGPRDPAYLGKVEAAKNPTTGADDLKNEQALRKEFEASAKPHMEVRRGYERLLSSKGDAAGDISLIFGYMKMLDPGSVVREGEFATAQNAAGIPDQIRNVYNRAMSGERLNANQRNMFKGQAKALYDASSREYGSRETQMRGLAKRYRLNPDNIIPSIGPGPDAISSSTTTPAPPAGFQVVQ